MNKPVLVQKVNSCNSLNKKVECFVLCKHVLVSCANDMKQVALFNVLQDQVDRFLVFERCVQTHYVLVLQPLLDGDLTFKGFFDFGACQGCLKNLLYSYTYATRFVHSQTHCAVSSFANLLVFDFQFTESDFREYLLLSHSVSRLELTLLDERGCAYNTQVFFLQKLRVMLCALELMF